MKRLTLLAFAAAAVFYTCTQDTLENPLDARLNARLSDLSPGGDRSYFILPDEEDYADIPHDPQNPLTREKVELGKMLFFETGLALAPAKSFNKETYSCATCHVPSIGFVPGRVQGIADGGVGFGEHGEKRKGMQLYNPEEMDVQGARPLSVMNVAFTVNTMWAGKFGGNGVNEGTEDRWVGDAELNHEGFLGLETQNIEGLHLHRMVVNKDVTDTLGYTQMFDQAFTEWSEEERYSPKSASFAISAYLRTLLTNEAPFQNWLKGDEQAMTEEEKTGALVFFGKAGCYRCHTGAALNNPTEFYALGVKDLYETGQAFATSADDPRNLGRGGFTGRAEDMYKFKVPQLYNMREAGFYFHGSSKRSLREVVEYFDDGVAENQNVPEEQLAAQLHPLRLTEAEKQSLVRFLEDALWDPNVDRYVPEKVLSGNCFPNNDAISRRDMGCE